MPNCYNLTRKGWPSPATLQTVDAELCQNLSLPFDDVHWTCDWHNIIGFSLAMGRTLPELIDRHRENETKYPEDRDTYHDLVRICAYLNEHYTVDAWAEIGRR